MQQVNKLFELIEDKFKNNKSCKNSWNPKVFIAKANQRCRDSLKVAKVEDEDLEVDMPEC